MAARWNTFASRIHLGDVSELGPALISFRGPTAQGFLASLMQDGPDVEVAGIRCTE